MRVEESERLRPLVKMRGWCLLIPVLITLVTLAAVSPVLAQGPFTVSPGGNPAVAIGEAGEGVIVWEAEDGDDAGVFGQRVAIDGTALGSPFRVNETISQDQRSPAVVFLESSAFVVVWESLHTPEPQVFGQCFAANGTALGSEFNVSTTAASRLPTIDADADGNFVIAWSGTNKPNKIDRYRTYLRRFSPAGTALGSEIRIGAKAEANRPALAVQPYGGDFLVGWRNKQGKIKGRTFGGDGTALGSIFRVGAKAGGTSPSADVGGDLEYTVVWERETGTGIQDVYVQRISRDGVPLGSELRVNATPSIEFPVPRVSSDLYGNTVVTWHCRLNTGSPHASVFVRSIDLFGVPLGGELLINPADGGIHSQPELAPDGNGGFLVIWERKDGDTAAPMVLGDAIEVP